MSISISSIETEQNDIEPFHLITQNSAQLKGCISVVLTVNDLMTFLKSARVRDI